MGAYIRSDKDGIRSDIERVYGLFPRLKERRRQTAGALSGGEQQMLAMGRAMMSRPKLLLLDEPSMGLAPLMVQKVFETIMTISGEGVTILLIEQNAKLALEVSRRGYVMESGEITLEGDAKALNDQQKTGLKTFMSKNCIACHNGINIGGNDFYPFGIVEKPGVAVMPPGDKGRYNVSKARLDEYTFRAAPLRNVALRAPYFHTGSVWTLEEAVDVMAKAQLGVALAPDENAALVAFLGSLTGEQPKVQYPILPARTKDTPRPQ